MKSENKTTAFGFLNIDKPSGMTSSAVVNRVKRLSGLPCGHMGTLDPLASGVLPVGIGNATRLFDYFLNKRKEYIAEFTFGVASDTLDSTGELFSWGRVPKQTKFPAFYRLSAEIFYRFRRSTARKTSGDGGGTNLLVRAWNLNLLPSRYVLTR